MGHGEQLAKLSVGDVIGSEQIHFNAFLKIPLQKDFPISIRAVNFKRSHWVQYYSRQLLPDNSNIALMVSSAFPSSLLLTKMKVFRFGFCLPALISVAPALRASSFTSCVLS